MMKSISLKDFLRDRFNMTLEEYENLEDEKKINEILDAYDHVRSIPEKKVMGD